MRRDESLGKIAQVLFSGIPRTFDELVNETGLSRRTLTKRLNEMVGSGEVVNFKGLMAFEKIHRRREGRSHIETVQRFQPIDNLSPSIAYSMLHAAAPPEWHRQAAEGFEAFERARGKESTRRFLMRTIRGKPAKSDKKYGIEKRPRIRGYYAMAALWVPAIKFRPTVNPKGATT